MGEGVGEGRLTGKPAARGLLALGWGGAMSDIETTQDLSDAMFRLVYAWCDRHALRALRAILGGWPSPLALSDDWYELRTAIRNVLAFARDELLPDEIELMADLIATIDKATDSRGF